VTTLALATCSFAAYEPRMGMGVRITLSPPQWPPPPGGRARWIYLAELAPRGWYFRSARFDQHYIRQLNRFAADIERKLGWLAEAFGPVTLCCYERRVLPGECHRLIAAEFVSNLLGIEVPELDPAIKSGQAARH
jgi:hypothetical protein